MPVVSEQYSECFDLRMLLLRLPGGIGFEDILTVDENLRETFQQACRMTGLLERVQLQNDTFCETAEAWSPSQLCMLFAVVHAFGEVDVPQLWATCRDTVCENFVHCYSESTNIEYALAEKDCCGHIV